MAASETQSFKQLFSGSQRTGEAAPLPALNTSENRKSCDGESNLEVIVLLRSYCQFTYNEAFIGNQN